LLYDSKFRSKYGIFSKTLLGTYIIMIKNKMALLGAAATVGLMGGAFVSPAQAVSVTYQISDGLFGAGGALTGSFDFDVSNNSYSNFNITSTSTTLGPATAPLANPFTYTSSGVEVVFSAANGFTIVSPNGTANPYRELNLVFSSNLTGVLGSTATLLSSPNRPLNASYEQYGALGATLTAGVSGGVVTAVPWETDALSVIGVTTLFGFGVWNKRKRKVDLSK
jgi:hypothetical protein